MLLVDVQHVWGTHDTDVSAVLVQHGKDAVLRLCHDATGFVDGGVYGKRLDFLFGQHLCTNGNGHGDEPCGGKRIELCGDDGAASLFRDVANDGGYARTATNDEASCARLQGEAMRLVTVCDQDHVAGRHVSFHHLGRGANGELAHAYDVVRVTNDELALKRVQHVLVGRAGA